MSDIGILTALEKGPFFPLDMDFLIRPFLWDMRVLKEQSAALSW